MKSARLMFSVDCSRITNTHLRFRHLANTTLLLIMSLSLLRVAAQDTAAVSAAKLQLQVWDSIAARPLPAATVAIYEGQDTSLLAYTLSGPNGEVFIATLPLETRLRITVSYVGYRQEERVVRFQDANEKLDLGRIPMIASAGLLDEVIILPPVRMNGDTLEYNAEAFHMDESALAEDLLRILPGVVIWSDGKITVKEKTVSTVLVNGKEFLGDDFRLATQNLPKDIIEKIQVYQRQDEWGKRDSTSTEINIQLKEGNEKGYLGKVGAGGGIERRFELEGQISRFNERMQMTIAGSRNNINKMANGLYTLMSNSTFKGPGIRRNFESNFQLPGQNVSSCLGGRFSYNLNPGGDWQHQQQLNADYFMNGIKSNMAFLSNSIRQLDSNRLLITQDLSRNEGSRFDQQGQVHYENRAGDQHFRVNFSGSRSSSSGISSDNTEVSDETGRLLNSNSSTGSNQHNGSGLNFNTEYGRDIDTAHRSIISGLRVSYSLNNTNYAGNNRTISQFTVLGDPAQGRYLDRTFTSSTRFQNNTINLDLPEIFSRYSNEERNYFRVGMKERFHKSESKSTTVVSDLDTASGLYSLNSYLSNAQINGNSSHEPEISIEQQFSSGVDDTLQRTLSLSLSGGPRFYRIDNASEKQFQNLNQQFSNWIGALNSEYRWRQNGKASHTIDMGLGMKYDYPRVQQLVPLVDSTNPNFIILPNNLLREERTTDISAGYSSSSYKDLRSLFYGLNASFSRVNNYIGASQTIDSIGRTVQSYVNLDGFWEASVDGNLRYSMRRDEKEFQIGLRTGLTINETPVILNDIQRKFNSLEWRIEPEIVWAFQDKFELSLTDRYEHNSSAQAFATGVVLTNQNNLQLRAGYQVTKRLSVVSSVSYASNTLSGRGNTDYTLWNAILEYRLFAAQNAEIKFSAQDLLNQNRGFNNHVEGNSISSSTYNVLQRYFLITFSWFPRKFGEGSAAVEY